MTNSANNKRVAYNRAWRASHPGRHAASVKAYRERHPQRMAKRNRLRRILNGAKWDRTYRDKHREKLIAKWAKRRALQRGATIGDLTEISKIYKAAKWWRQWFDVQVDHIVALSRDGAHTASNLRIIYGYENRRKRTNQTYTPNVIFCHD